MEKLFKLNFPNASIYRGSLWIDPKNEKEYENDLIVIIDTFAIVIEAKSGEITPPAKRGAPDRLQKTLKALIEEPAKQTIRFIDYLKHNKKIHIFPTRSVKKNVLDNTNIKYYIPLTITFENLGVIGCNQKEIIAAGLINKEEKEIVPSMSLTDLECIFDVLTLESEKIHYLGRRREFEYHVDYKADELDLFAFYLDNGFNIGETEYKGEWHMSFLLKSKELDPFFLGREEGVNVKKPELSMIDWWRDILNCVSKRKTKQWIETSYILLNTTKEDQIKFKKMLNSLKSKIKSGKTKYKVNYVSFLSGPKERRYLIVGFPYNTSK